MGAGWIYFDFNLGASTIHDQLARPAMKGLSHVGRCLLLNRHGSIWGFLCFLFLVFLRHGLCTFPTVKNKLIVPSNGAMDAILSQVCIALILSANHVNLNVDETTVFLNRIKKGSLFQIPLESPIVTYRSDQAWVYDAHLQNSFTSMPV